MLHLDGFKKAERGHPLLAPAFPGTGEELPFVDPKLAADHLVSRLGVPADFDPLDVDLVALLNVEGEVDGALLSVDRRHRGDVRVRVALVVIDVGDRLNVAGQQ